MPDFYLPAAAGAYAVVISLLDDGSDPTTWTDEHLEVTYPTIVAWRVHQFMSGGSSCAEATPIMAEPAPINPSFDMLWLVDHDARLRDTAEGFVVPDLDAARRVTLRRFRSDHTVAKKVAA